VLSVGSNWGVIVPINKFTPLRASFFSVSALVLGCVAPLSANSAIAQDAPLSCGGNLYQTDGTGLLFSVDIATHVTTPIPMGSPIGRNALGLSPGGLKTYSVTGGVPDNTVFVHDATTGTVQSFPSPNVGGFIPIRGAVNPFNGFYYFADNDTNPSIYAFDTTTTTPIGVVGTLSPDVAAVGNNGDFVFDSAGTLYVTIGDHIYRADTPVPTTASSDTISLTTLAILTAGANSPGIAFACDGYLYVGDGTTTIFKIDPSTGASLGGFPVAVNSTDLGSCATPSIENMH